MTGRRLWLFVPWALFLALVAGWLIYWTLIAQSAETRVQTWIAAQRAAGADAEIAAIRRHGFPILLRLELDDAAYAPSTRRWRARTAQLDLNVNLLDPQHVVFQPRAPIAFDRAGAPPLTLSFRTLLVSVHMQGDALREARLEADAPDFAGLAAQKALLALRPDPRARGDQQLALDFTALHLKQPLLGLEGFGQDFAFLRAGLVIHKATALLNADALEHWRGAGGSVTVDGAAVQWGPLDTQARGAIALDAQHRLSGALQADIPQPAHVLSALAQSRALSPQAQQALRLAALSYATRAATLRFTAADGMLRADGAAIRPLTPLY